ncbi:MAG TPA: response regulator transcription factor [Anaerolineales bacterium]
MIRVLVADDHAVVRQGLKQILSEEPDILEVGEAGSGAEALRLSREAEWDVVILDITMPDGSGLDILRELRHEKPQLPVLVLSVHSEDQYALRVLRSGAAGYLTKECAPQELVEAVRRVVSGGKYVGLDLAERLAEVLAGDRNQQAHEQLSDREFQILCLIGSGRSATEIAQELSLSPKTVSTYRRRVLDKMHMNSNVELTRYVLEQQLIP